MDFAGSSHRVRSGLQHGSHALERRVQLAPAASQVVLEPLGVKAQHRRQPPDGHLLHRPLPRPAPAARGTLCTPTQACASRRTACPAAAAHTMSHRGSPDGICRDTGSKRRSGRIIRCCDGLPSRRVPCSSLQHETGVVSACLPVCRCQCRDAASNVAGHHSRQSCDRAWAHPSARPLRKAVSCCSISCSRAVIEQWISDTREGPSMITQSATAGCNASCCLSSAAAQELALVTRTNKHARLTHVVITPTPV